MLEVTVSEVTGFFSLSNGKLAFCGAYYVPGFKIAQITPQFFLFGTGESVKIMLGENRGFVLATNTQVFYVNYTDGSTVSIPLTQLTVDSVFLGL